MKHLQVYLCIFLGLGLILNINANAANTKKIDYLCISQNKDNKKEYVKHKDDEYIFQVFYKNKILNLQKNKNCAYKVFATDSIFQPLFDTLSDKNVGTKILADGSWGLTKTIKKKIFLKEYENLKTTKKKPSQTQSNDNSYLVYYLCLNTSKDHHGYVKVQKYSKENNEKCENKVYAQQHRSLYFAIHEKRGRFTPSSAEKKGSRGIGWTRFMYAVELNELISKENKKGYKFVQFPIITNAQIAKKNLEKDKNNPKLQKVFISKRIINHEKNKRIVNVKSKKVSDVSYCYRPNTEILFLATSYNGSCKDQGALNAGFDGENFYFFSDSKTQVVKLETDNDFYYGVICARTNKHSWDPNRPVHYRQLYIFNNEAVCSSLGTENITYELFNKIRDNPQKYSKGWEYNALRKKLGNKICLLPNGKINNLSNKCNESEKELYISEKSSGKSIILLPKNNQTKIVKNNTQEEFKPEKKIKVAKKEKPKKKKKVEIVKVEKPKQEEFKPKKTNQDKDPPIIEVAENITVSDSAYEIKGNVKDKSKKIFIEVDGQTIPVKKGKFKLKRFSPVDEQIKIVAIDQWGNRSKPKIVNVTIDIKNIEVAEKIEPLNPTKMRSRKNKDRVALIIGIEKYIRTPAANFANLDAKFFYEYSRKGFGIPKSNIKLLVDEEANLVKSLSTLSKWLPSKVKAGETELIIFFAGHGLASSDGKELYILPHDSDPDLLNRTALSRSELFKQIIDLNPKSVTMFMDTCYSGISRDEKMLLASARPIRIIADEENDIPSNFTIFTASQLNQISSGMNEAKHGIFSYYLMKGLEGNADTNKDRVLTNGELLSYMDKNVSEKASLLGRNQNPSLAGDPNKILMSYR